MNTVYLSQAEPLLRGAHAATIDQKQRDELRAIHCRVLQFMRGTGIFIGEIPPDKTSAPSQSDPLTPDPACPHCEGKGYHGAKSVFDRCICTYGNGPVAEPERRVVMDEDDAREKDMREKLFTLQSENDAWRADSQMLNDICTLLNDSMPGFKGVPSTPEWTIAAVRELLEQWKAQSKLIHRCAVRLEAGKLEDVQTNAPLAKECRDQINTTTKLSRGQS